MFTVNLEEVNFNPRELLLGFKTSMEKVSTAVVEIARELELQVEPGRCDWMLQSNDKLNGWGVASHEQRKWCIEMESIFGEDAVKTV